MLADKAGPISQKPVSGQREVTIVASFIKAWTSKPVYGQLPDYRQIVGSAATCCAGYNYAHAWL